MSTIRETNCAIHWTEMYLVDNPIHLLKNWSQDCARRERLGTNLGKSYFQKLK